MENENQSQAHADSPAWARNMKLAHQSQRCRARRKSDGGPCQGPAVKGRRVCRMHGAKAGAPCGARNGRFVHGSHTLEAKAEMKQARAELASLRAMLAG